MIAGGDRSTAGAARQQEQARKNRRKAARSARRKNRQRLGQGAGSSGFHVADELVFQSVP
jgi:hypothetical protein